VEVAADLVYSSAAISAHRAMYMLNHARIQSMLRSKNYTTAVKILADCDYKILDGSVDRIIEIERQNTYEMFTKYCPDETINTCVTALYNFSVTPVGKDTTHGDQEKKLRKTLEDNVEKIKHAEIKKYCQTYLDAWAHGRKADEGKLWKIALDLRNDLESVGPLFFWYIQKKSEFAAVKIILMGKQHNHDRERIVEELGELYERFV
jgi:vacuolar-type H+-ATPase subunit C/Vma6